ncbi:metallopeptidase family protein [bacterium]|nr:metallopeptidase family protein [bacterium]
MTPYDFEQKVAVGIEVLPQRVRERMKNVVVLIEDEPSAEDRKQNHLHKDETLLGLYKGIPLSQRGSGYGIGMTMPDSITLYRKPILETAEERKVSVEKIISETILHEFAHFLGMNEEEVRAWEARHHQRE